MGEITAPDGTTIWFRDEGVGPPIILVAGLGDAHGSWDAQVADFAQDHRVIALDNRGIGNSSTPPGPYTIAQMADDTHAVAAALGLSRVTAIGSSMGGAICQEWALRHPADVGRLVIANSWGERDAFATHLFDHWISMASAGAVGHLIESLLLFCFSPAYLSRNPGVAEAFLAQVPPRMNGFVAAAHACRAHDTSAACHKITAPTIIIPGRHDILLRPELSQRLQLRIGHAYLTAMDTAHMTFWEQPEIFSVLVRQFIRKH